MKRFWLAIMAALLVTAIAVPAFAWEFSMTGEFEYRMRYFGRTGTGDLFGNADLQNVPNAVQSASGFAGTPSPYYVANAAWIGFAGPNIYQTGWQAGAAATSPRTIMQDTASGSGVAITRGGFSRWGSDATYADQRISFNPTIRVNNAIRVHGVYTIGGLRQAFAQRRVDAAGEFSPGAPPFERYYMLNTGQGAYLTGAIGSWEQMRATIQLPVGLISIGKKDFVFGNGAVFAQNYPTDSFMFVVPYGPFRFLLGTYPGHSNGAPGTSSYDVVPDGDSRFNYRFAAGLTYDQGPMTAGVLLIPGWMHWNAAYSATTIGENTYSLYNADVFQHIYIAFLKYTNGRVFLNIDWWGANQDVHKVKTFDMPTRNIADYAPQFTETYGAFVETGVLAGPAKLSLMYASSSGPVLNNYGAASNANYRQVKAYGHAITQINYQALQPYSFLMFPTYGGGNNTFNNDGTGQMSDAFAFAARLDYATAANLNLFGSFLWAHRLEQAGTYAGQYYATSNFTPSTNSVTRVTQAQNFKGVATGVNGGNPYVDDGHIGWEAQAGFSWKLLEGLNMEMAYSYWHLGKWFDQAYMAFTPDGANGGQLSGPQGQGYMIGRDNIQSVRGSFTINF